MKHKKVGMKPKSNNPFDSSSSSSNSSASASASGAAAGDEFFDCKQEGSGELRARRVAPLDFSAKFGVDERPAVNFQKVPISSSRNFFSPLVGAMMEYGTHSGSSERVGFGKIKDGNESDVSSISEATEQSSLLSEQHKKPLRYMVKSNSLGGSSSKYCMSNSSIAGASFPKARNVLKELQSGDNEYSIDYKFILLEDLGTASSWVVLLLPYIAFLVCLLLESANGIKLATTPMMSAETPCPVRMPAGVVTPEKACHYPFFWTAKLENQSGVASRTSFKGFAFDSGYQLPRVPVISNFLYGDTVSQNISTAAVSLVAQGKIMYRSTLLQRKIGKDDWELMYSSDARQLSMACELSDATSNLNVSFDEQKWECKSPRIVDVIFSMPGTVVYAGGDLRIVEYYFMYDNADPIYDGQDAESTGFSFVFTDVLNASKMFSAMVPNDSNQLVEELVSLSAYSFEYLSLTGAKIDTYIRLGLFVVSLLFFFYWIWSMSTKNFVCRCYPGLFRVSSTSRKETMWWESPWMLFPERSYIVILLISLLLIQEPLLVAMFFFPDIISQTTFHFAADICMGIGVQGILFVYLCLFHGFRHHTASVSKRRTDHQRRVLELRRAAKYITETQQGSSNKKSISEYEQDYYERFGDINGSASSSHLRLQHDLCGDGWADFLLPKLLLLLMGSVSVVWTAYCRFPINDGDDAIAHLSQQQLTKYKTMYVISSFCQFAFLVLWIGLILKAAFVSGKKLRREPFLNTRPVQLAFRILFAHMSLGFTALAVTFGLNLSWLQTKWSFDRQQKFDQYDPARTSKLEITMKVLADIARQFPYSGTATSVGSGKVFFASVAILITAYIFLPVKVIRDDDDIDFDQVRPDNLAERRRQKRDKRTVVRLARDTKSWRVFPLPIKECGATHLHYNKFQLYQSLRISPDDPPTRGMIAIGPYMPIFCLEIACWLNEASWQAYYPPPGLMIGTESMNIQAIGLQLEGTVIDNSTNVQAFVASNLAPQVDGEKDSIIVVGFRGTVNAANVKTDLRLRQVPLFDQIAGIGTTPFCVSPESVDVYDSEGWIWDTPNKRLDAEDVDVQCIMPQSLGPSGCVPSFHRKPKDDTTFSTVKEGARAILRATPIARNSFPFVHEGFQEVYCHVRQKVIEILLPCLQRQLKKATKRNCAKPDCEPLALPKIYVCGHSLGGALAQLLALDLANNCEITLQTRSFPSETPEPEKELFHLPAETMESLQESAFLHGNEHELRVRPPIAVYTFGQPRLGNRAFARLYKQKVPHTFRVVNEGDAVTAMPNFAFCHGIYKHAGLEVLLDEGQTGNVLVGPTVVETTFRFSKVRTSVMAHTMERYRNGLECAFDSQELLHYYQGHMGDGTSGPINGRDPLAAHPSNTNIPDWMTQVRSAYQSDDL